MRELMVFLAIGIGTLGMRAVFLVSRARLPVALERSMRHAKPAILAALVGSYLAGGEGGIAVGSVAALALAVLLARKGAGLVFVLAASVSVAALIP